MTLYILILTNISTLIFLIAYSIVHSKDCAEIKHLESLTGKLLASIDAHQDDLGSLLNRVKILEGEKVYLIQKLANLGVNPFESSGEPINDEQPYNQINFLQ